MKKKTAKRGFLFLVLLYFVFLTLLGLADYCYPDTQSRFSGDEIENLFCFSCTKTGEAGGAGKSAAVVTETQTVRAFGVWPVKNVEVNYYSQKEVVLGGELFGIRLKTEGLLVSDIGKVESDAGAVSPALSAGFEKGDVILSVEGVRVETADGFSQILNRTGGKTLTCKVRRGENEIALSLTPVLCKDGLYKAGLWIRDGAAGIGTVTYTDPETGVFGGLGHGVCDSASGALYPLGTGTVSSVTLEGIKKGSGGAPGELRGSLSSRVGGSIFANTACGVYGAMDVSSPSPAKTVPVGLKGEVKPGKARLVSQVSGKKEEYEIEIEEILSFAGQTKNFVIRVTDERLLALTGGIVQGMSGSPIMQNGKLVGAVTHVLVGDPTRGYGIFLENMLLTASKLPLSKEKAA